MLNKKNEKKPKIKVDKRIEKDFNLKEANQEKRSLFTVNKSNENRSSLSSYPSIPTSNSNPIKTNPV